MSVSSPSMKVGKYKGDKTCCCRNPDECRGLTAAFVLLKDGRKGFVKLPNWKEDPPSQYYVERNQQRESYLRHLLPGHPVQEPTPTKNIALHHFHPKVTGRFLDQRQKEIPKTVTEEEMEHLGIDLDDRDRVIDEFGFPTGECIFVPNYPMQNVKDDLKRMILINRIVNEALEEQEEKRQAAQALEDAMERERQEKEAEREEPVGPSPIEILKEAPDVERRRELHVKLEKWEMARRGDYAILLETKTAEWRGSIDFLEDGVREIARAERLVLGAALADKAFSEAMHAISHDSFVDEEQNVVTEAWKQNRLMGQREAKWMPTDLMHPLVEAKNRIGAKYMDAAEYGQSEIGRELTVFREEMEIEVGGIQKMGDSLLREMEASEKEVQTAWDALHGMASLEFINDSKELSPTTSNEEVEKEDGKKEAAVADGASTEDAEELPENEDGSVEVEDLSQDDEDVTAEDANEYEEESPDEPDSTEGSQEGADAEDGATEEAETGANIKEGPLFVRTLSGRSDDSPPAIDTSEASPKSEAEDILSPLSEDTNPTPRSRGFGFLKKALAQKKGLTPPATSPMAAAGSPFTLLDWSPVSGSLRKITAVKDVWVRESLYREAAQHQAKVWHTCLGLLSKMNDAMKEIELERSVKLHAMLLDFLPRERRLFNGLPAVPKPVMEKLMAMRLDETKMQENIDEALHKRSRIVLRIDNDQRSSIMNRSRCMAPDLSKAFEKPLKGEAFQTIMYRCASVVERKVGGKQLWQTTLAVVTADYYLHFFDTDIDIGSTPEEAIEELLPSHEFPTAEALPAGPRTEKLLKELTPTETINLLHSKVSSNGGILEVTETCAGRFRERATRKFILKTNGETDVWEDVLSRRPEDELPCSEERSDSMDGKQAIWSSAV